MRKTIVINGISCEFKSSAAIPRMYRIKFNRDVFLDLSHLKKQLDAQNAEMKEAKMLAEKNGIEFDESQHESRLPVSTLEIFENIAHMMHKHGDPTQPKDTEEWLEQFEIFDIYEVLPQILEMWEKENHQKSVPKKENEK